MSLFVVILVGIFPHSDWIRRIHVYLRVQSECRKMLTRISLNTNTFHAVGNGGNVEWKRKLSTITTVTYSSVSCYLTLNCNMTRHLTQAELFCSVNSNCRMICWILMKLCLRASRFLRSILKLKWLLVERKLKIQSEIADQILKIKLTVSLDKVKLTDVALNWNFHQLVSLNGGIIFYFYCLQELIYGLWNTYQ